MATSVPPASPLPSLLHDVYFSRLSDHQIQWYFLCPETHQILEYGLEARPQETWPFTLLAGPMPQPSWLDRRRSERPLPHWEVLRAACVKALAAHELSEPRPTPLDQYLVQSVRQVLETLFALDWPADEAVSRYPHLRAILGDGAVQE